MHTQNNSYGNMNGFIEAGTSGAKGHGYGGNNITMRGEDMPESLASGKASRNIVQAHFKVLRFYRKVCRLLPFILRIHDLTQCVNTHQAMINVANVIRQKAYLRDPGQVDRWVFKGYEQLMQAEWQMLNRDHLFKYLANDRRNDIGYSYLEEVKMKGKSGFLKDFYNGNKTMEY